MRDGRDGCNRQEEDLLQLNLRPTRRRLSKGMADNMNDAAESSTSSAAPVMFKKRAKAGGSSSRSRSIATPDVQSEANSRDGSAACAL